MTLQNRVTPFGEIVAEPARGTVMGNRGGCLHDAGKHLTRRRWASQHWICCRLAFKDRKREVMTPRCYTELFFLDEATALAAGHRPCAECRRTDFNRFATLWNAVRSRPGRALVAEMDRVLHAERFVSGGHETGPAVQAGDLPDGAMVAFDGGPHLKWGGALWRWSFNGYAPLPAGGKGIARAVLITPPSIVRVMAGGFRPGVHPGAES